MRLESLKMADEMDNSLKEMAKREEAKNAEKD